MIVEDEPELGKILLESLSQNGYSAHLAESAEKALNLICQKAFDLIVSDIRLPDMNGLQLLDHLKGHSHPEPVILMTALTWMKEQEWRGNVRELKNVIERAVLISSRKTLEVQDFWEDTGGGVEKNRGEQGTESASLCLKQMEQRMISKALEKTQGNRTHAAKMLGISIRTLRNKLSEYKKQLPAGLS